jgi:hypothetical protein
MLNERADLFLFLRCGIHIVVKTVHHVQQLCVYPMGAAGGRLTRPQARLGNRHGGIN